MANVRKEQFHQNRLKPIKMYVWCNMINVIKIAEMSNMIMDDNDLITLLDKRFASALTKGILPRMYTAIPKS